MRRRKQVQRTGTAASAVQLRDGQRHPFTELAQYVPLQQAQVRLYRGIREAVPVVDAAVLKIIRLVSGVQVQCADQRAQRALEEFLSHVSTGRGQQGIQSFLDMYLDSMLTCGRGVGELVISQDGRQVCAVLAGNPADVEIKEGDNPLDFILCSYDERGQLVDLPRQDLLLFTPLNPEAENPYGVSMLRSMPFLAEILLKVYTAMGANWERMGNVRFSVVCKPDGQELDGESAQERSAVIAKEWSAAMQDSKNGRVRDFVAVGDVEIKAIGADNQILDSEVPVRQILEQLIARTGIPPFMLGLSWSTTERMSTQQADMLTSELYAIRRSLEPVVEKIAALWLRLHGYEDRVRVEWNEINLQDEVDDAKAELYRQQAARLKQESAQPSQVTNPQKSTEGA